MVLETSEDVQAFLSGAVSYEDLEKLQRKELKLIAECLRHSLPENSKKNTLVKVIASSVVKGEISLDTATQVEVLKLEIEREKLRM